MTQQVNKLIFILREMVEAFEKLITAALEKHEQMISFDANRLERRVKDEVELLNRVMQLEERSGTILNEINNAFFRTNSLVLGEFVELCRKDGYDETEDLSIVYAKLKELSIRLKKVNEQNQNFAKFSLIIIKDTIRFICKESKESIIYTPLGKKWAAGSLLNIVDTQA